MAKKIDSSFIDDEMTTDVELAAAVSALDQVDAEIMGIFNDTKEPTGHVNRTQSELSFDEGTRTLTISPVSGSFTVYVKGVKLEISTTLTKQIPDTSGNYFFYIDNTGTLDCFFGFNPLVLTDVAYTAFVHWNATIQQAVSFGEERHGTVMDGVTHSYLHTTRGTQLVSGGAINYTLGDGSILEDAIIELANMQVKDEDITANIVHSSTPTNYFEQQLTPIAYIPIYYRDGSEWVRKTAEKTVVYKGTTRARYNYFDGSAWSVVDANSDDKILVSYVFATTNISEPVIALLGQDQYNTLDEAKTLAAWDKITFGDLPAQEMKLLYIVYYQTSSSYVNDVNSKIVYVSDIRYNHDREVSATTFNGSHDNLSGLENDSHPQYHNNARGDIRYYLKSEVDTAISTSSADDRNRANHTGTQLASTISDFTSAVQAVTIDAAKIDGGVVSNAEFATLDGITTGVSIQSQIDGKESTITTGTTSQYFRGDKTFQTLNATAVANTPSGNIAATTVQAAINELDTEKQATGNYITALTGDVTASGPGSVAATLSNTGVVAGTYSLVTVDAKGRVTTGSNSGSITRYSYVLGSPVANSNATYTAVAGLTSASLPIGMYKFTMMGRMQSSSATSGVGVRLNQGTAVISTIGAKWFFAQGANGGTAVNFQIDQLALNTNLFSASVPTVNTNMNVEGSGFFRITTAGTVTIEIRSELNANIATLAADSFLLIELV